MVFVVDKMFAQMSEIVQTAHMQPFQRRQKYLAEKITDVLIVNTLNIFASVVYAKDK